MSFRVKLDDGSEIGPLDLDTLRTWYREGLIGPGTPAQRMGASRWSTLERVVDLKRWGSTSASRKRVKAREQAEDDEQGPGETPRWRTLLASVVLFVLAGAAGAASLLPERVPADLDGAPFREVALVFVVPALLLVRGWELGRKLARLLLFLASFALLAAGGALFARQAAPETWFALGSAWLVCSGLVAFLARGGLHWFHTTLWLLVVAAGFMGLGRYGYVPRTPLQAQIAEWTAPDARWTSEVSGWSVQAPPGWVRLREGNPVAPFEDAAATFAAPRLGAIAVLRETRAAAGTSLDRDLDALVDERRRSVPGLELVDRSDEHLGGIPVRRGTGRWERDGRAWQERAAVWHDGWLAYSLSAWAPAGGAGERAIGALEPVPAPEGTLDERVSARAAELAAAEPLLAEPAARDALRRSGNLELKPDEALLSVLSAVAAGRARLEAADASRLASMEARLESEVARRRRPALRTVLAGQGEAAALQVLRSAAARLDGELQLQLAELWSRAAALGSG